MQTKEIIFLLIAIGGLYYTYRSYKLQKQEKEEKHELFEQLYTIR